MADRDYLRRVRMKLGEAQNHRCAYCGDRVEYGAIDAPNMATFDHVRPRCNGGRNTQDNLVIACLDCNQRRGVQNAWKFHRNMERMRASIARDDTRKFPTGPPASIGETAARIVGQMGQQH